MRKYNLGVLVRVAPDLPNKFDVMPGWLSITVETESRLFGVFRSAPRAEVPLSLSEREFVRVDPLFGAAAVKTKYNLPELQPKKDGTS